MARLSRVIAVDVPHHVTQRGNARRFILDSDADRLVYWQLLQSYCQLHHLSLLGYCLMSNHVHLIVIPRRPDSIALTLKHTHGRYAAYFNTRHLSSGHVWQGRYYSCPLDPPHLWAALRYTELNPVRAGLVAEPEEYPWSSAALHCGRTATDTVVDLEPWREGWNSDGWSEYLKGRDDAEEAEVIRRNTHTGRPLGTPAFVSGLEKALGRRLRPEKGGRPPKEQADARQEEFLFERLRG
jgi:putative transposase